jgi:hypothetical protein
VSATPAVSKPSDSDGKSIKEEPLSPGGGSSQKIQFSDLQSILGNLGIFNIKF